MISGVNSMGKQPHVFVSMDRENIEAYTPKYAVDIILPYISKEKVIWSPFSRNEHHFANYLRKLGYKVINTHLEGGQIS